MRVSTLLKFNTLCNLFFGLPLLVIPNAMMAMFGIHLEPGGVYIARMAGASWLGLAVLTWLGRELPEAQLRLAILPALLASFAVGLLAMLFGQLTGVTNFMGWPPILLAAFFVAAYGYALLHPAGQKQAGPAAG